jgi:hypothetical protein
VQASQTCQNPACRETGKSTRYIKTRGVATGLFQILGKSRGVWGWAMCTSQTCQNPACSAAGQQHHLWVPHPLVVYNALAVDLHSGSTHL